LLWLAATTGFAIIGCTWAFSIARYGGPDEPAHVIRAAAVARGDLLGKPVAGMEEGYRQVTVATGLASGDPACFRHDETITAACTAAAPATADIKVATSAGTAPPWYYAIVGTVARALSDGSGALAYRMVTVLMCAAVLGYALARSRRHAAGGWMLVAFTPSAWFLIGVVGTSGIEIALITLAVVEAVGRFHWISAGDSLARVMVPLSLCLLLRPAALIDVAVVALVVAPTAPRPLTKKRIAMIVTPLLIAGIVAVAWSRWTGLVVKDQRTADSSSLATTIDRSLRGIPTTIHQAIGALGWNEFYAPVVAQVVWIAALALAVYWTVFQSSDRWWHARWVVAGLLLPTLVEALLHRRIGAIWQGRYSIPFAMAGVLYAARAATPPRRVMRALVIAAAFAEVLTLWHTLRRYMVGLDGSYMLRDAAWHPLMNPWLLIVINATATAWLAAVALGLGDDVAEHVDDEVGEAGVVVDGQLPTRS
jgi:hypothetical protein